MPFLSLRPALSAWIFIGLAGACASGKGRREPAVAPMVTAEDIEHNAGRPIEEVLQAKVPGLLITRTAGGGIAVEIRGPSSFLMSNEPLYVIDDVPIRPGPAGALAGVNPYDIESIQVSKNPADIAIYGMRGVNGVIIIKTKRPARAVERVP